MSSRPYSTHEQSIQFTWAVHTVYMSGPKLVQTVFHIQFKMWGNRAQRTKIFMSHAKVLSCFLTNFRILDQRNINFIFILLAEYLSHWKLFSRRTVSQEYDLKLFLFKLCFPNAKLKVICQFFVFYNYSESSLVRENSKGCSKLFIQEIFRQNHVMVA